MSDFESNDGTIQARLDFASQIWYLEHKAALYQEYLQDCYDGIFWFQNSGGLALVSPQYFQFGKELMEIVVNSLHSSDFDQYGNSALRWGWDNIENSKDILTRSFLECSKHYTGIDNKAKEKILERLGEDLKCKVQCQNKSASWKEDGKNHVGIWLCGGLKGTKVSGIKDRWQPESEEGIKILLCIRSDIKCIMHNIIDLVPTTTK